MSLTRGLARDAVASVVRHAVAVVAGVVSVPILARSLGAERLGFWSFLGTVAFLLSMADLGLNSATLRAAAGHDAQHARTVARLSGWVAAAIGIPVAVGAAYWLTSIAERLPEENRADARQAVMIALVGGMIAAVSQPVRSYAQGQGYLVKLAWARAVAVATQFGVTVTGLWLGYSLRAVAVGLLLGATVEAIAGAWAARDGIRPKGLPAREHHREIIRTAGAGMMTNLAVVLAVRMDLLVLERITNLGTIGAYSVAQRIVDQGFTLVKQLSSALVPRLGARGENRDATIALGTMILGALAGAPFAALAVAGRPLVVMWAGPAVDQPILGLALGFYALSAMLVGLETVATSAISLGGNAMAAARYVMIASLVNVLVSVVGGFLLGPWAVAAGTAAGSLVCTVLVWRATRAAQRWSWAQVTATMMPPVSGMAASALLAFWLSRIGLHVIAVLVTATACGLVVSSISVWRFVRGLTAAARAGADPWNRSTQCSPGGG